MTIRIPRALAMVTGLMASTAHAQVVIDGELSQLTLEGWVNATAAICRESSQERCAARDGRTDAALRALLRTSRTGGPDLGLRLVAESTPKDRADLTEASVLMFGRAGRLEFGQRQGLPDVLTGYAPNSFTFTSAEYGPASGSSLDPGGGLPASFLPAAAAAVIDQLGVLGYATQSFDDRSTKLLYVAPKTGGWLAGLSYATDADDARYGALLQAGLVREAYFSQHVLRIGASWAHAEGAGDYTDLDSINAGVTLVLDDTLTLGVSGTANGSSGLEPNGFASGADGWVASVNYNVGAWTAGAYYQRARGEGDVVTGGDDRLEVVQVGVSWRTSTRLRIFGAWFGARIDDEGLALPDASVFMLGVRATL